eukprot:365042-Chlamydomonas_euryale.AAC.3
MSASTPPMSTSKPRLPAAPIACRLLHSVAPMPWGEKEGVTGGRLYERVSCRGGKEMEIISRWIGGCTGRWVRGFHEGRTGRWVRGFREGRTGRSK